MRRYLILALTAALLPSAVGAKRPATRKPQPRAAAAAPAPPPVPQLTGDERLLHALNRLTFGPRPGDLDALRTMGLETWLERQLNPESIPPNAALEAKLAPLDTLTMPTAELVRHYPTPQMVRLMTEGKLAWPEDPQARYSVEKLIARFRRRENADLSGKPADADLHADNIPASWQLDDDQRRILENGKPPEQVAFLAALPAAEQLDLLDTLPNGARQRLYPQAPPDLRRRIQIFNGPVQVVNQDLMDSKILRAVYSDRQLEEVLTDFWFNHFNVNLDKGADRYNVTSYERDAIRPHVLGHFKDLLLATAQSPAMLFYLDNWQSAGPDPRGRRRQGLNENYGRELMELHTLGVDGGYTQQDVTEVARCFTGWTIREPNQGGGFDFNDKLHDKGEKHVLGVTIPAGGGIEDGMKVLDILAQHPATARFISKSLATRFVADDPPEALVSKMADTFIKTDGDLREVLRTMLHAPEFWAPETYRAKVKSPFEMVVSAIRAVNADVDFGQALTGQLNQLGQPLYRKLEPTGYSNRGADWMNSASLLARMNFATALVHDRVPGVKVDISQFSLDATRLEKSLLNTDPSPEAKEAIQQALDQQQQAGAFAAGLTLGSPDFQRK
jgi:uncharacterized protein (DUF1800 family)